jgi:hypothetical protein
MFRRLAVLVLFASLITSIQVAHADDDCNSDCPSGKVKSSFLDGQHVTCVCIEQGSAMEDNPADGNPPSGGEENQG